MKNKLLKLGACAALLVFRATLALSEDAQSRGGGGHGSSRDSYGGNGGGYGGHGGNGAGSGWRGRGLGWWGPGLGLGLRWGLASPYYYDPYAAYGYPGP